ncbi:hypothetical protein MKW98_017658 [Papaver atlanticum]|uniref:3'-5' exonuclease domain-containing protein n=1 Tax=Papaver atlanticum TaxID=357466 RepID=A0AAD4TBE6_9MAGN|nr:hypothetical protein MKW98_017658 [Papaver atlanticum]
MALVHQPIPPFVTSRYNKSNTASSSNGVNIGIRELDVSQSTHHTYMVSFYNDRIYTVVTQTAWVVDEWISKIYNDFHDKLDNLVVGLDCEWRVNFKKGSTRNKIAVLQLCVGHQCLIFQFACRDYIPVSLHEFLNNEKFIFVGVGVAEDGDKLFEDYGLSVARTIDLRTLAAEKLDFEELEATGLKGLAFTVLRRDLPKPKNVTLSRWDESFLTNRQIQYACLDAFVSFKLGIVLMRGFKGNLYHLFSYGRNQR